MTQPVEPYPPYQPCLPDQEEYFSGQTPGSVGWIVCAYNETSSSSGWQTDNLSVMAPGTSQGQVEAAISAVYGGWASIYQGGSVLFRNVSEVNGVQVYEYSLEGFVNTPYGPVSTAPPMPVLGPSVSWITGQDVAACCAVDYGSNAANLDVVAIEASMALYQLSGRQFAGLTTAHVRPMNQACNCEWAAGLGPWWWGPAPFLGGYSFGGGNFGGWGWYNEQGTQFGCNGLSRIKLAGYPVRQIRQVKINGTVLDPSCYRLDEWRYLTRMDLPGPPYTQGFWPTCQSMGLNDDQPGTFSIDYLWGVDPPPLGKQAAQQLACQLWMSCSGDAADCLLPAGVTKVDRQGVSVSRDLIFTWMNADGGTGLVTLDVFMSSYCRNKAKMRSAVFSPDVQQYARPFANTAGNAVCADDLGMDNLGF